MMTKEWFVVSFFNNAYSLIDRGITSTTASKRWLGKFKKFKKMSETFQNNFIESCIRDFGFEALKHYAGWNTDECLSCSSTRELMWIIDRKSKTYFAFTRFTQSWVHFIPIETVGSSNEWNDNSNNNDNGYIDYIKTHAISTYAMLAFKNSILLLFVKTTTTEADFLWCHHSQSVAYIS